MKFTSRALGFFSIRQISSGELMHSVSAPSEEANRLYIEQSALADRLIQARQRRELVIWDVGLGAAFNAMAAVSCFERCYAEKSETDLRRLRLVSFEWDLDALTLAAKSPGIFPQSRHSAPFKILSTGQWQHRSLRLCWDLHKGDFRELIASAPAPDIISTILSRTKPILLWTAEPSRAFINAVREIRGALYLFRLHRRARCAFAGRLFCQHGVPAPAPNRRQPSLLPPHGVRPTIHWTASLGSEWLRRWRRSGAKFPARLASEERPNFEKLIETHPQFSTALV